MPAIEDRQMRADAKELATAAIITGMRAGGKASTCEGNTIRDDAMSDTIKTTRLEGNELIVETKYGTEVYDSKFLVAALLIYVAKGSGTIEPEESAKMIDLIEQHFQLEGAESLELLTRAMSELAEKPELTEHLVQLGRSLSDKPPMADARFPRWSNSIARWRRSEWLPTSYTGRSIAISRKRCLVSDLSKGYADRAILK
jgi:tellurite resistance protein